VVDPGRRVERVAGCKCFLLGLSISRRNAAGLRKWRKDKSVSNELPWGGGARPQRVEREDMPAEISECL